MESSIQASNIGGLAAGEMSVDSRQGKLIAYRRFANDGASITDAIPQDAKSYLYKNDVSVVDLTSLVGGYSGASYPKSWVSLFHSWKSRLVATTSYMKTEDGSNKLVNRHIKNRDNFGRVTEIVEFGTNSEGIGRETHVDYKSIDGIWLTDLVEERRLYKTVDQQREDTPVETVRFTCDNYGRLRFRYDNGVPMEYLYFDTHPQSDLVKETKDARNRRFTFSEYKRGIPQKEGRRGKGNQWEYRYRVVNDDGTLASESRWGDSNSVWTYDYDAMRRIKSISSPRSDTAQTVIEWDSPTYMKSTQGRLLTETRFDGFGRVVFEGSTDTSTYERINKFYRFDKHGRQSFQSIATSISWEDYLANTKPTGTSYRYDKFNRVVRSFNSGTIGTIDYKYNTGSSLNVQATDRNQHGDKRTTETYFNYFGDFDSPIIDKIVDGNGVTTHLTYDVAGKITSTVRDGITRSYKYNSKALLESEHHPETNGTYYWYGLNGLLTRSANNSNWSKATNKTRYQHDLSNRIAKIRYGDGVGSDYVDQSFIYNENGNLEQIRAEGAAGDSQDVTIDYAYDEEENLLSETLSVDGQSFVLGYQYDDLSGLRQRSFPTGNRYNYAPDAFGRATEIVDENGKVVLSAIKYHPDGQPATVRNSGGVYVRTRYAFGYPNLVRSKPGKSGYHGQRYGYDNTGNVVKITHQGVSDVMDEFSYDGNSRLKSAIGERVGNWHFTYDNHENIKTVVNGNIVNTYHYDEATNRLTGVGGKTVTYDSQFNVNNFDGFWSGFNKANQIYSDGNGHEYRYDGHGLRVFERYGDSDSVDYTFYDRLGVLRYRHGKKYNVGSEYHTVSGQLFARRDIRSGGNGSSGGGSTGGTGGISTCQDPQNSDPDGDGWGWENGASCKVDSSSGGGSGSGGSGSGGSGSGGTPSCQNPTVSDPDGDGWGWENGASCRVDATSGGGSGTGGTGGGTPACQNPAVSDSDGDGWGWENGASCRVQ